MNRRWSPAVLAGVAGLASAIPALGQMSPAPSHDVPWGSDSGEVMWRGGRGPDQRAVYATVVTVPGAAWVRLSFGAVKLAGRIEEGSGSWLRITSLADGAVQRLDARSVEEWSRTSAYFNGDSVLVELVSAPGVGPNRVAIATVTAGDPPQNHTDTICFGTDDRTLSSDPRQGRHSVGCTAWMWNDTNRMFGTAGHCNALGGNVIMFNVPLSTASGALVNPPPEDQYPVDGTSTQRVNGGVGNDWCYFGTFTNSNTGLTPFQKQGACYTLASAAPATGTPTIRVTGYGTVSAPVSPTWQQVQKTHTGPYAGLSGGAIRYTVDTTGGNSGSPVVDETNGGEVIGVHTHGGCNASGGYNTGTAVQLAAWAAARGSPLGQCRTGAGVAGGNLFAVGDGANNFGTCSPSSGAFAKVNVAPPRMEGLAYSWIIGKFYGVSNDTWGVAPGPAGRKLWTIDPGTGVATHIANITGASGVINALGFDPSSNLLYGVIQATGTRVTINPATAVASVDGVPNTGTTIGAAEYSPSDKLLYGIDDSGGASKLVRFTPATGTVQVIGPLGAGIADCNGLAITQDGSLWTINAATDQLLRIDVVTGAATVVGSTQGSFGASFGMSAVIAPPAACYANCDASTAPPALNVGDFTCFLERFASGDAYANCDGSVSPPVLNVSDFTCFLQKYAAGCSAP